MNKVLIRYRIHNKQISNKKDIEQRNNAMRIRERQFNRLGLTLDQDQYETISNWSNMNNHCDCSNAVVITNIIGEIEKANNHKHIYGSVANVGVPLYKELFKWIIRSKSGIKPIKAVLNMNPKLFGTFLLACFEIIGHKIETIVYYVTNNLEYR